MHNRLKVILALGDVALGDVYLNHVSSKIHKYEIVLDWWVKCGVIKFLLSSGSDCYYIII